MGTKWSSITDAFSTQGFGNKLNALKDTFKKKSLFSEKDTNLISDYYIAKNNNGLSAEEALTQTLGTDETNQRLRDLITHYSDAADAADLMARANRDVSLSAKVTSVALNLLSVAANAVIGALIAFIANKIFEWIDNYINRVQYAREALEETISEIESVDSQIKDVSDSIDELLAKDTLTLTDENELKRLQEENQELENRKRLLSVKAQKEQETLNANIEKDYNRDYTKKKVGGGVMLLNEEGYFESPTQEQYLQYAIDQASELLNLNHALSEEEQDDLDFWQNIAMEKGLALANLVEGYQPVTEEQKKIKEGWEAMIADASHVSSAYAGSVIDISDRLKDRYARGVDFSTGSNVGSATEDEAQISHWIDSLSAEDKRVMIECDLEDASLKDLQNYLAEQTGRITEETPVELEFDYENIKNLESGLSSIESAYSAITGAMEEYNNQGYLSMNTLDSLTSLDDDYINQLVDENGNLQLNAAAMQNLALAKIDEAKAATYQEFCTELARISKLEDVQAANELARANGTLSESAYRTAKYLYLEAMAWEDANKRQLAADAWEATQKRIAMLDSQAESLTSGIYNFGSAAGEASEAAADFTQILEAELNLLDLKMDNGLIDFQTYIKDRTALIQKYYDQGKISADKYYDYLNSNYEKQLSYMDKVVSAVTRRFDKEIDSLKETISGIEAENDSLNQLINNYDTVISVVNDVYEAEQDALRAQQDAIQKKIDALKEANDEQEKEIALEKAKYSLEQAQTQRTRLVFDSETNQFVYKQDTSAIRDAQKEVDSLETEAKIDELQKEKDSIQVKIDKLDELKAKWNEISSAYKIHQNQLLAQEILGKNYEQLILSGRIEDVEAFQQRYVAAQQQINDNEAMIASYNERIEYYELQKQQWSDIADTYEQSVTDQIAAMVLGQDWESKVLSGRQQTLEDFKNNYIRIQTEMTQSAIENANKQVEAYTNAANNTITSGIPEKETYKVVGDKDTVYKTGFATQQEANNWIAQQEDKKRYSSSILRGLRVVPEYHSGLLGNYPGLTPDSRYNTLKTLGTRRLSSDEFLALLRKKELVYTQEQQDTTLSNLSSLTDSFLNNQFGRISKFSTPASLPSGSVSSCTFTTGDIQLYGVQDVCSMAEQIKKQFHNVMYQRLKMS